MLETFLLPIHPDHLFSSDQLPGSLANHLRIHQESFPDLSGVKIALFGVNDRRIDGVNQGASQAADAVRAELYRLMKPKEWLNVADLGNVEAGDTAEDTLFAVQTVLHELSELGICAVVLGGDEKLAIYQYHALKNQSANLEITYLGRRLNLREGTWFNRLVLDENSQLFNLTVLGYQTYLTEQASLDAMERMFFDPIRLGTLRSRLQIAEPCFRSSHLAIFDCGVIRASDFPGTHDAAPNGLFNEEACQMARYAGLSNKCQSIGFYNYSPALDPSGISGRQVAHLVWHFLEAFPQRRLEEPQENAERFLKYRLGLQESHELIFYKSQASDRWWMEIPHPKSGKMNTMPFVIPCEYEDYLTATEGELPDRWWRFYQKYSL
ncbi:MAG: arginase family protein [Bacteroidota bacterium]|nr:arginase family protein [Bacteroidota bacterium]MDX5430877.1 arginase family protein [Bacteroidota bacterium]MDX5469622.1 arginase family protein [Bacteroidota bacterium]